MSRAVTTIDPLPMSRHWSSFAKGELAAMRRDEPLLTSAGLFLLLLMLPTAFALAVDERLLHGVAIWLKPLKFQFSLGTYLLTLAFFARFLPDGLRARRSYRLYAASVVAAILAEMAWIGGAAALGTASHFNGAAVGMALYAVMGVLALWLTSASAVFAWQIGRSGKLADRPALKEGIVIGLALVLPLTAVTAGYMSSTGSHLVGGLGSDAGGLALMGWAREAGDMRVAHFFATHAMHFLPLAALAATLFSGRKAVGLVRLAALAYVGLVAFTFLQALAGRPFLAFIG